MIIMENVSKAYRTNSGKRVILDNTSTVFPRGKSVGILGHNGAGKSTLVRMLAGVEAPDRGTISRKARVSWPLGFGGAFHSSLSGAENARFAARIYGADARAVLKFVEDFAELGAYLDMPVRTYSSGMRARLAFGVSMAIEFDVYLVDEITAVGDERFKARCQEVLKQRMVNSDIIIISHSFSTMKAYCDIGVVLDKGKLVMYDDLDEAIEVYKKLLFH
jgi:capsular polysaccharide transport system ATP-binding protein